MCFDFSRCNARQSPVPDFTDDFRGTKKTNGIASGPNTNPMTAQNTGLAPLLAAILWQRTAQTRDNIKTANTDTGLIPTKLSILQIEF